MPDDHLQIVPQTEEGVYFPYHAVERIIIGDDDRTPRTFLTVREVAVMMHSPIAIETSGRSYEKTFFYSHKDSVHGDPAFIVVLWNNGYGKYAGKKYVITVLRDHGRDLSYIEKLRAKKLAFGQGFIKTGILPQLHPDAPKGAVVQLDPCLGRSGRMESIPLCKLDSFLPVLLEYEEFLLMLAEHVEREIRGRSLILRKSAVVGLDLIFHRVGFCFKIPYQTVFELLDKEPPRW